MPNQHRAARIAAIPLIAMAFGTSVLAPTANAAAPAATCQDVAYLIKDFEIQLGASWTSLRPWYQKALTAAKTPAIKTLIRKAGAAAKAGSENQAQKLIYAAYNQISATGKC